MVPRQPLCFLDTFVRFDGTDIGERSELFFKIREHHRPHDGKAVVYHPRRKCKDREVFISIHNFPYIHVQSDSDKVEQHHPMGDLPAGRCV